MSSVNSLLFSPHFSGHQLLSLINTIAFGNQLLVVTRSYVCTQAICSSIRLGLSPLFQSSVDIQAALYELIQAYRNGDLGRSAEETQATLRTIVDLLEQPNGPLNAVVQEENSRTLHRGGPQVGILATEFIATNGRSPDDLAVGVKDQSAGRHMLPNHFWGSSPVNQRVHDSKDQPTEFHGSSHSSRSRAADSGGSASVNASGLAGRHAGTGGAANATDVSPNNDTIVGTTHHRIVQRHAEGGLGAVYLATDDSLHRAVALKEIKPSYVNDIAAREQFLLEAQITARLTHPGIVPIYAIGAYPNGCPYYTMRFIEGQTLLEAIKRVHARRSSIQVVEWQLELKHLVRRFVAACHAIAYAHHAGYLHRDIKPQNIMLGEYGETLVVDWGLAIRIPKRHQESVSQLSNPGSMEQNEETRFHLPPIETPCVERSAVGTPAYMSPEQTLGRVNELDERSDIFALGCTLYEILTGEVAFGGTTRQEVTDKILAGEFSEPRTLNPALPQPLAAVCVRALGLRKQDRYNQVNEFVADLELWLDDEPPSVYQLTAVERASRWLRRHRTVAISGSLATLATLLIALVALILVSREQRRTADALARETVAREQTLAALDTVTDDTISQALARQTELDDADRQFFQNILLQYEKLLPPSSSESEQAGADSRFQRARGAQRVGTLRRQLSMLDESEAELRRALELLSELDMQNPQVIQASAKTHFELGLLLASQQMLEPALEQYQLACQSYEQAHQVDRKDVWLCQAAIASNNHANVLWRLGRKTEARAAYDDALAALPISMARNNDLIRQKRILLLNNYAGTLKSDTDTIKDAIALYEEALDLIDRGLADDVAPSDRMATAATIANLAAAYAKTGKIEQAKDLLNRSITVQQPVVDRYPGFSTYQQQFAKTQLQLGLILAALKHPTASQQLESAQRSLQALANRFPERPAFQVDLADAIEMQTRSQYGADAATAKAKLEEAIAIRKALADDHRADVVYLRGLLATQIRYANELRTQQLYADAVPQYEQILAALEVPEIVASGLSDGQARNRALFGIADALSHLGEYSQALKFWDQLLQFEQDPDHVDFQLQRILCLMRLGWIDSALVSIDVLKLKLTEANVAFEPVQHYDLACCYSVGGGATEIESQKRELLGMAMRELAVAEELGFFKDSQMVSHARTDDDLACLRGYSEGKQLLVRIGLISDQ